MYLSKTSLNLLLLLTASSLTYGQAPEASSTVDSPRDLAENSRYVPFADLMAWAEKSDITYEISTLDNLGIEEGDSLADLWWPQKRGIPFPWIEEGTNGQRSLKSAPCSKETLASLDEIEKVFNTSDYDTAFEKYRALSQKDQTCHIPWSHMGDCRLFANRYAAALPLYEKAIELNPWDYRSFFYKANTLYRLKRGVEAVSFYRQALQLNPRPASIVQTIGGVGSRLGVELVDQLFEPRAYVRKEGEKVVIYSNLDAQWLAWGLCKALWQNEDGFREQRTGSKELTWLNSQEDSECILVLLEAYLNSRENSDDPSDPYLDQLFEIAQAGLLGEFWAYEIASRTAPHLLLLLPEGVYDMGDYVKTQVLVSRQK